MNRKKYDLEAQEKRLGLNFGKQQVSKRLYNVGDFSPYNLFWESTLPQDLREQYRTLADKRKIQNSNIDRRIKNKQVNSSAKP